MDERLLGRIKMFVGVAGMLLGDDALPGVKDFVASFYKLTPEQKAALDDGLDDLLAVQRKLRGRRAEIAAEPK